MVVSNVLVAVVDVGDCLLCRILVVEDAYDAEYTMSISKGRIIRLGVSALKRFRPVLCGELRSYE